MRRRGSSLGWRSESAEGTDSRWSDHGGWHNGAKDPVGGVGSIGEYFGELREWNNHTLPSWLSGYNFYSPNRIGILLGAVHRSKTEILIL
jgi:hypothetical protein